MQQALQNLTPEVLGREVLERLLHALGERLEHLPLERLQQLLELALRLGLGEVVLLELADAAGGGGRGPGQPPEPRRAPASRRGAGLSAPAARPAAVGRRLRAVVRRRAG